MECFSHAFFMSARGARARPVFVVGRPAVLLSHVIPPSDGQSKHRSANGLEAEGTFPKRFMRHGSKRRPNGVLVAMPIVYG